MSKEQIERRIRMIFYFLFGVVFSFLFILTSSYLGFLDKANAKHKDQVMGFITEGINIRERFIFEDFMTQSYDSLNRRLSVFLERQGISKYSIVTLEDGKCTSGTEGECKNILEITKRYDAREPFRLESLGSFYVVVPIVAWGEVHGFFSVIIPVSVLVSEKSFLNNLLFHVLPFIVIIGLTLYIYFYTEKYLIKPTIQRIIESEKIQAQKSIVRQYAHDIRSPLSVLECLIDTDLRDEESKSLLLSAIERIKSVSEELLNKDTKKDKLHIQSLLNDLVRDKHLEFKNKRLVFDVQFIDNLTYLHLNYNDTYRVLSNLVNNAIEASQQEVIRIGFKVGQIDNNIMISVLDNGIGIPPELIEPILEGGFSTKNYGYGLGLSGARKWLESIKGSITIDSTEGAGTTVNLSLPGQILC